MRYFSLALLLLTGCASANLIETYKTFPPRIPCDAKIIEEGRKGTLVATLDATCYELAKCLEKTKELACQHGANGVRLKSSSNNGKFIYALVEAVLVH